jgi:hypothetical protein
VKYQEKVQDSVSWVKFPHRNSIQNLACAPGPLTFACSHIPSMKKKSTWDKVHHHELTEDVSCRNKVWLLDHISAKDTQMWFGKVEYSVIS